MCHRLNIYRSIKRHSQPKKLLSGLKFGFDWMCFIESSFVVFFMKDKNYQMNYNEKYQMSSEGFVALKIIHLKFRPRLWISPLSLTLDKIIRYSTIKKIKNTSL